MMPLLRIRALLGVLLLWAAVPAAAQTPTPAPTNDDCLVCHSDPETKRADGQPLVVDQGKYATSVHGQLELKCVDCHADIAAAELPHAEDLAPVECGTCHDAPVAAYRTSIHGQARAGGKTAAASCASCHGSHDILPSSDPASRTYHLNIASTCSQCHGSDAIIQQAGLHGGNVGAQFADSIHGLALSKMGLIVAPTCASCHGSHDVRPKGDAESRVNRGRMAATCGTCHEGIEHQYERGAHGQQVAKGNLRAPVCADCHSAHGIQSAQTADWRVDVVRECGTCHTESLHTYRDTFHGQVTELGYARIATCADCHGAHEMLPTSDPNSPVSDARRLSTCQKCHPSATAGFARFDPHANAHDHGRNPLLYYTAQFMQLLLWGVFSFFGLHSGLWFVKSWRVLKQRRAGSQGQAPKDASPSAGGHDEPGH
jgi:hypothetical protein